MFTGIIEEIGSFGSLEIRPTGARLRVNCHTVISDAAEGSSIAVNGVCLTAVEIDATGFSADLAPETLRRTNLGSAEPGSLINLERPLLAMGRLHGHVVQGHVDGVGEVLSVEELGDHNYWLSIRIPADVDRYVVHKGSIAIDGISLTVAAIKEHILSVTIIPHTFAMTAIRTYKPGNLVNLECDIFAKYLEKLAAGYRADA